MTAIGILSDTHINNQSKEYRLNCAHAFPHCDAIIHAGDLTNMEILSVFSGKDIYAVSGNMCDHATKQSLPESKIIVIDGYSIAICHGAGSKHNIEERLLTLFPDSDCIVYGHTHIPTCHTWCGTLFLNPGSFQGTGHYGAPGTYGLIRIDTDGLKGSIHELKT